MILVWKKAVILKSKSILRHPRNFLFYQRKTLHELLFLTTFPIGANIINTWFRY